MRQFTSGKKVKYENLFSQVVAEQRKRLWFTVTFECGGKARLGFESTDGQKVKARLAVCSGESMPSTVASNEFFNALATNDGLEFANAEEMYASFTRAQGATERSRTEQASGSTASAPQRITRERVVIDRVQLAEQVKSCIIGQDEQIDGIVGCICNHLRKTKPKKPIVIMLAGPTGVGKTATARKIAELLQEKFGKEQMPLITIRCNEFKEPYRISQLLGSPAGYVGHDEACVMEPIKKTDSAIIVFDEFEKAHNEIHTAVMDWMDTGRITLSRIKDNETSAEYDCAGSVIILTSNIDMRDGAAVSMRFDLSGTNDVITHPSSASNDDRCRRIMVQNGFKPEIAGRVSRFFEYKSLTSEDIAKIAILTFKNKFTEYGFIVDEVEPELQADIQSHYTSSQFGVRPLENALEQVLGRQLPAIPQSEQHLKVGGTLQNLIITEI